MKNLPLFKHQTEAVNFALGNGGNAALFHDCGLGKTRTGIEIFAELRKHNPALKLLVVCPKSLINAAWGEDVENFSSFWFSDYKKIKNILNPRTRLPDIIGINYETLRVGTPVGNRKTPSGHFLTIKTLINQYPFMCICDESSKMKAYDSITYKALSKLAPFFKHRIVASGTPMPNTELEVWTQIDFLSSGTLPTSFYQFRNLFFHLEKDFNGQKKIIENPAEVMRRPESARAIMQQGYQYKCTSEKRDKIIQTISPLCHWVKKEEALDLPEKVFTNRIVTLSAEEMKAYKSMKDTLIAEILGEKPMQSDTLTTDNEDFMSAPAGGGGGGTTVIAQNALSKLMKLRQITSGFLYDQNAVVDLTLPEAVTIGNTKFNELFEILEELGDKQVVIWCQYRHEIKKIAAEFERLGKTYHTLYGGTKDKDLSIKGFKDGGVQYILCHPRSAAHGITWTNCDTMIYFSLDYSYEAYEQSVNRIHRAGQKNKCLYIHIIAENTLDAAILKVLNRKGNLQGSMYSAFKEYQSQSLDKRTYREQLEYIMGGII